MFFRFRNFFWWQAFRRFEFLYYCCCCCGRRRPLVSFCFLAAADELGVKGRHSEGDFGAAPAHGSVFLCHGFDTIVGNGRWMVVVVVVAVVLALLSLFLLFVEDRQQSTFPLGLSLVGSGPCLFLEAPPFAVDAIDIVLVHAIDNGPNDVHTGFFHFLAFNLAVVHIVDFVLAHLGYRWNQTNLSGVRKRYRSSF